MATIHMQNDVVARSRQPRRIALATARNLRPPSWLARRRDRGGEPISPAPDWCSCRALIVEEAGGKVTDTVGRPLDFSLGAKLDDSVTGIIATNGPVHAELLEALA